MESLHKFIAFHYYCITKYLTKIIIGNALKLFLTYTFTSYKKQRILFYIEQMLRKLYTMNLNPHGVIAENYHCVVLCVAKKN